MSYCIYLRKSRADMEAEARGEGETLARHEAELLALCKRMDITPSAIYREIVSGETIAARPVMQQLLSEVQDGKWSGVLVMEIERLARGDTIDQGIVSQAFRYSNTRIITPRKTFDPSNEFDEEYFEFNLFMSRREYKTILRRMQTGRATSVREGKYIGSIRPYGYNRVKIPNDKGFTLEPIPSEAETVRTIFDWYLNGYNGEEMGCQRIARKLNELRIETLHGKPFTVPTVRDILNNPVYIGKVRWNRRKNVKHIKDGHMTSSRPVSAEYILADGLHPPIISEETFYTVQEKFKKNPPRPIGVTNTIKSPFAGLIYCKVCGRAMIRRPYPNGKTASILCQFPGCSTVGSNIDVVEMLVLRTLKEWSVADQEPSVPSAAPAASEETLHSSIIAKLEEDLKRHKSQLNRLYDLLEQGLYSTEEYVERSSVIKKRIADTETAIESEKEKIDDSIPLEELTRAIAPRVREVLSAYTSAMSPEVKNRLFSSVINTIIYDKRQRNVHPSLLITPRKY